ncbi:hypothetical protein ANAPC5_01294 [Anaplasma phagocytophilum]|nr:hypothetical protein ANAPC5_01294 [Anaplasma phagocytophilum]
MPEGAIVGQVALRFVVFDKCVDILFIPSLEARRRHSLSLKQFPAFPVKLSSVGHIVSSASTGANHVE